MDSPSADYGPEARLDGPELDWSKVGWPPVVDNPAPTITPKASKGGLPAHDDFFESEDAELIDFDSMDPFEETFKRKQNNKKTLKKTIAKKKRLESNSSVTADEPGSMSFSSEPADTSGSELEDSEDTARSRDNEDDESEDDSSSNEEDSDEDDSEDESDDDDDDSDDEDDDTSGSDDDTDDSDDDTEGSDDTDDDESDDSDSVDDDESDDSEDESGKSNVEGDETKPATNQNDFNATNYSSMNARGMRQKVNDSQSARSLAANLAQQFVSNSPQGLFPVVSAALFGGAMAYLPTATQSLMELGLPKPTLQEQNLTDTSNSLLTRPDKSSLFSDWFKSSKTLRK